MRHFCASVFVIDPTNKKMLLVKHRKFNKWVQPGGHIEDMETPEETAMREVFEETGIKVQLIGDRFPRESDFIKPLGIQKNHGQEGETHIDIIYLGIPVRESSKELIGEELTELGWFSRSELENISVFQDIKITFDHILQNYFR